MNLSSLINLLFLLSCLIILTESRVHEIATFGDGLASLPCEVDFKNCGEIYFITWSKNVSNEWQRVYSYSQGYQKALGHFSGQPNRISMDDSNMTTTGIAYLRIKNLALSDEGTYKCDVTYVHGNCPSLTYSKLFTLVKPGKPVIRINGEPLESKLLLKTDESSDISRIDVKYNPDKGKVNSNVNSGKSVNKNINESDNDSDWESTVYQVGPFTESSTLTLECSTTGGRPIPEIKWFNGTRPLRSKVNLINRETGPSVTSTIRLVVTRSDVGVKFGCSVWNNATKIPLTKWISLEIHVKPLSLKLRRPKAPVVSGEMVSLTCTVDGARPPASIVWFNRSEVVTPHPTSSTDLMSDGTYRTWSKLVFIASRYDHNGEFFCKGVNQVLKERNEVPMIEMTMLQVLYPPAVTIDPGGRIAVNESSTINLACSFDANPPNVSDIVWYKDGNLITGNDRRLPIQIDETSLTIKNVTHSHSGFYSCSLKNSFGTGNSTNHAYIDVWYPPKVSIDLRPSVIIETGKSLILQCLVSQGNPVTLTHVQWYFNGNHFETTHDPSASSLTLTNITSSHTGNYSCLGFNGARYPSPISSPKQLIVQYKPSQANLTVHYLGEMASKGITVTLVCSLMGDSGNPPAHSFVWLHQGTLLEGVDSSSYSIKSLSVSNQGNYSCAAVNKLGEGPFSHQIIKVKGAPRLIKGLPVTMGILRNQSVTVSCQIECEPLCPIEWFINNESLGVASSSSSSSPSSSSARVTTATASSLSSDAYDTLADGYEVITEGSDESLLSSSSAFYHINFSLIKEDASSNQLASSLSYLYIKNNSWLRDNDIISCQSQTNGLGPPVKSSTIYRNEYAPERVKISISQLELLEGDKFADNLVVCSASANPSGHYHWIKGSTGQLISQGANLYFNETRINKDLRDNYTCVVTNKHGSGQAHFILNVLYRPECFIHKESLGGNRWLLSCEATSNPPVLNFTWYRYNRTVGETVSSLSSSLALSSSSAQSTSPSTVKLEFLSSGSNSFPVSSKRLASLSEDRQSSVLVLEENDLEAYSCIATNVIGTSLPCRLKQVQINAPSGWVQLLFKDENLIIVGSAFGLILFVVVFGLAIGLVFFGRRKLKSLEKSSSVQTHHHSLGRHHYDPSQANSTLHHYATQQNANHQPYQSASQLHQEQQLHPQVHHHLYNSLTRNYHNVNVNNNKNHSSSLHHYSSQKYASINQSKTSSLNKLPILEERTIPDGRCSDNNCDADDISPYGHQRSPLITRSHQCITLGPVSSPLLLSEYLTDDNESETQITESPNSMNHYYESTSPLHRANYKNTVNSKSLNLLANTNNNSQNTFINVNNSHNSNNTHYSHTLIHEHSTNPHYNIPLTLSRHPPPLPPLPPERTHRHHANPAIYDYSRYHTNRIT